MPPREAFLECSMTRTLLIRALAYIYRELSNKIKWYVRTGPGIVAPCQSVCWVEQGP